MQQAQNRKDNLISDKMLSENSLIGQIISKNETYSKDSRRNLYYQTTLGFHLEMQSITGFKHSYIFKVVTD